MLQTELDQLLGELSAQLGDNLLHIFKFFNKLIELWCMTRKFVCSIFFVAIVHICNVKRKLRGNVNNLKIYIF